MKGYTLIEILVVLSIVGIVLGVGYAGFREFSRRQLVASNVKTLKSDVRLATGQALAGKKPAGCLGVLQGYEFSVDENSGSYTIEAVCSESVGDIVVKSVLLPEGLTIGVTSPTPILFKPLGEGTNIPSGGRVEITLTQGSINYSRGVVVEASGNIEEGTFSL